MDPVSKVSGSYLGICSISASQMIDEIIVT